MTLWTYLQHDTENNASNSTTAVAITDMWLGIKAQNKYGLHWLIMQSMQYAWTPTPVDDFSFY